MKKPIIQGLCALSVFSLCSFYLCLPIHAQLFGEQSQRTGQLDNTGDSAENSAKDIDIQNADLLEIEDDKIILTGNVKVKSSDSSGKDILVNTQKLIALKDAAGEVYEVKTLTRSDITSEDFKLSADLLKLKKDALTGRFNALFADGNVLINSTDSSQTLKSPKVRIDLDKKKLYAYDGVITERIEKKVQATEGTGVVGERKSVIKSEKQLIDLDREKEKLSPVMTLLAVGKPVANVNNDEIIATGDEIRIYTQNSEMKRVEVNNSAKVLAKQDGKNFDLASDEIELQEHPGKSLVRAFARDPKKKASILKTTDQTATADEIVIIQNKENKDKSDEKGVKDKNLLLLYGNARLIDKDGRKLNSAFAKIDLDRKDLFAGLVSRSSGSIDKVDKEKFIKK